jgi:hypothetical protein
MTGPLPSLDKKGTRGPSGLTPAQPNARGTGHARSRIPGLLRKVGTLAPLAVGYGAFQAVLSSLPPMSYEDLHYLCAVGCGLAAGGLTGCAVLWVRRPSPGAMPAQEAPPPQGQTQGAAHGDDVMTLFRASYLTLLDTVVIFDDPALGTLTGWPHFFHEAAAGYRPTPYGTAYGLKLAMTLGDQDGRLERAALAETLWKLRRPDGGWASRTQGSVGRPEVTALVLGALFMAGCDYTQLMAAGDLLESMLSSQQDTTAVTSTYIVCTLIRELARVRPRSPLLTQLRTTLLSGAVQDPRHDNLVCWSPRLDPSSFQAAIPSPAHTAMAVVALARARQVSGDGVRSQSAMEQAVRWLVMDRDLGNRTEQIRRFITEDRWESLTARLFTAAWVSKALLAFGTDQTEGAESLLDEAIAKVIQAQHGGIWEWEESDRPIWMTYQGISTLHAYALRRWAPR